MSSGNLVLDNITRARSPHKHAARIQSQVDPGCKGTNRLLVDIKTNPQDQVVKVKHNHR